MMIDILIVLALWRVTHLITRERGLFGIASGIRSIASRIPEMDEMVKCFACMSLSLSILTFALIHVFIQPLPLFTLYRPLAFSGGAMLIQMVIDAHFDRVYEEDEHVH